MSVTKESNQIKQGIVFDRLYEMIIDGYFRSGESLSEREIAEMFGVSRTPVREAFRRMEKEGLVIYEPMKGVTIPSFSIEQINHLYKVREYIEGLSARLLTEKDNQFILQEMRLSVEKAEIAAKEHDIKKQAIINGQFHQLMAEGTENPYLINIFRTLRSHISLLRATSLSYQDRSITNIEEHKQICEAIASGDADLAERVACLHVRNSAKAALSKINTDSKIIT